MAFEQIRSDRTLSRMELALAISIIAGCLLWFFSRMNYMTAVAEATMLSLTIRNINTGLMGATATHMLRSDYAGLAGMDGGNPVGIAIEPPAGYIGEISGVQPESIEPGQWYFDTDGGWLAYHVVNRDYLADGSESGRVRVRIGVNYEDVDGNGSFSPGTDAFQGTSAKVLDPLHWTFRRQ